jgi:hypothetical protein
VPEEAIGEYLLDLAVLSSLDSSLALFGKTICMLRGDSLEL